jgi:probable selenium-dependent hydroxylase accessory protein YqeC
VGSLSAWFDQKLFRAGNCGSTGPIVVTIIGSGGKTSLVWHLARHLAVSPDQQEEPSRERLKEQPIPNPRTVLVTTTTKMFLPTAELSSKIKSLPNIAIAGRLNPITGKLEALPPEEIAERIAAYDLVLIEGDGSRRRPLKGWAEHEPVVPPFTTATVGMLPLWPVGNPVSEELIHRLSNFRALTGAAIGETLRLEHFVKTIAGGGTEKSLFTAAVGRKILFFNQIEDESSILQAEKLISLLPVDFRQRLHAIIAGSVKQDRISLQT